MERRRLDDLTDRWRARHEARVSRDRPSADPEREALAARSFPYRSSSPATYVAEHGAEMVGFTFDEASYADPELDAWLLEVGRLLGSSR